MADELRYGTATIVTVGPCISIADGVTKLTSLTVANSKATIVAETDDNAAPTLVLDNVAGNDSTNTLAHVDANDDAGFFSFKISAAQLTRYGRLKLSIDNAAVHLPMIHYYEDNSAR